ncbi:MAG: VOC family protein [Hyphomicrobiales bacterium]|nr:VOC family protein [Hyphomicrobiales bacterium]
MTARIQTIQPATVPFAVIKIGHVVLNCRDLERSTRFYTEILGFRISDIYEPDLVPGGMVFLRFNGDHHGVGLVGAMEDAAQNIELHHLAFEIGTVDELLRLRAHLEGKRVTIDFQGRRRAGGQIAVEFADPDGHQLEFFWGLDRVDGDGLGRPRSEWRPARSLEEAIANPVPGQNPVVRDTSLLRR